MKWYCFRTRTLKCVYPLDLLHLAALNPKYYGFAPKQILLINNAGNFFGAIAHEEVDAILEHFTSKVSTAPQFIEKILSDLEKKKKRFSDVCELIVNSASRESSHDQIAKLFNLFNEIYIELSSLTWLGIALLPQAIERETGAILKAKGIDGNLQVEYQSILTTPLQRSFMLEEEAALVDIARLIKNNPNVFKAFIQEIDVKKLRERFSEIYSTIKRHVEIYGWIPFDYIGPAWDEKDIFERITDLLRNDLEEKQFKFQNYFKNLAIKQQELTRDLNLTEWERNIFKISREITLLQDRRKEIFTRAHFSIGFLLREVELRFGLEPDTLHYLTANEIYKSILEEKPPLQIINRRKKIWAGIFRRRTFKILTGKFAQEVERNLQEKISHEADELLGTGASGGIIKGVVKIVLEEDHLGDLRYGEILVTKMTTPAFVIAMRKAKAIITDEGGITSHAAIVSRELGIPCIVGTKYATELFKNGDFVEVNAYEGRIRKINKFNLARAISKNKRTSKELRFEKKLPEIVYGYHRSKDPFIQDLIDINSEKVGLVGGKAASLSRLAKLCPVPKGFCLTTLAFEEFRNLAQITRKIKLKLELIDIDNYAQLSNISSAIQTLICKSDIPTEIEKEITREYKKLDGPVAVRSSSNSEDLTGISAAGQHDSYLAVVGESALRNAIKKCWASLYSARAISYRVQKGIQHDQIRMAVIVQKMVKASKSGVLFTVNPVNLFDEQMLIEATFGLGELLVSGKIRPDSYLLDKKSALPVEINVGVKNVALYLTGKNLTMRKLNIDKARKQVLSKKEMVDLGKLGVGIENHFGVPQDIEWAIDDNIHILQSRPITTLGNYRST